MTEIIHPFNLSKKRENFLQPSLLLFFDLLDSLRGQFAEGSGGRQRVNWVVELQTSRFIEVWVFLQKCEFFLQKCEFFYKSVSFSYKSVSLQFTDEQSENCHTAVQLVCDDEDAFGTQGLTR